MHIAATALRQQEQSRGLQGPGKIRGLVAVDPKTIPYGTLLFVPGYGYCIAEDTGAFRNKRPTQIDVFMETETEARNWGRKHDYKIYIVEWG